MTVAKLNAQTREDFVAGIGWVFEHSPWVAERAAAARPFHSLDHLADSLNAQVLHATRAEQLSLLRAHPDLATKAKVTPSSAKEQAGAGLDRLTAQEYERISKLNSAYQERFGFPFIYAVKGSDKFAIMEAMERRLASAPDAEFAEALQQVFRIARFRLEGIIV